MNLGKVCSQPFLSPIGRYLETGVLNNKCKDYLCPEDDFIREMFPTLVAGKLRAKALDPYGAMIPQFYGNRQGLLYYLGSYSGYRLRINKAVTTVTFPLF